MYQYPLTFSVPVCFVLCCARFVWLTSLGRSSGFTRPTCSVGRRKFFLETQELSRRPICTTPCIRSPQFYRLDFDVGIRARDCRDRHQCKRRQDQLDVSRRAKLYLWSQNNATYSIPFDRDATMAFADDQMGTLPLLHQSFQET